MTGLQAARGLLENLGNSVFRINAQSEVLGYFMKKDETFNLDLMTGNVEHILIPLVLDAYFSDNQEEIRRYLSDEAYRYFPLPMMAERINEEVHFETKILDISSTELLEAKVYDHEAVLIFKAEVQYIHCIVNVEGEVVEGGPSDIRKVQHVYGLAQDPSGEANDWEVVVMRFGQTQRLSA